MRRLPGGQQCPPQPAGQYVGQSPAPPSLHLLSTLADPLGWPLPQMWQGSNHAGRRIAYWLRGVGYQHERVSAAGFPRSARPSVRIGNTSAFPSAGEGSSCRSGWDGTMDTIRRCIDSRTSEVCGECLIEPVGCGRLAGRCRYCQHSVSQSAANHAATGRTTVMFRTTAAVFGILGFPAGSALGAPVSWLRPTDC